jgi:hypothetical protein
MKESTYIAPLFSDTDDGLNNLAHLALISTTEGFLHISPRLISIEPKQKRRSRKVCDINSVGNIEPMTHDLQDFFGGSYHNVKLGMLVNYTE